MKDLPRTLGFWDGAAITMGKIIGSGIFLTAPAVCLAFASATPVMLLWLFGGLMTLAGVFVYSELSAAVPQTGGLYVYLAEAYGKPIAFVYGWGYLLVRRSSAVAAQGMALAGMANILYGLEWDPRIVAAGSVVLLTALNILGTRYSALGMRVFTGVKVLALVALILVGFGSGAGDFSRLGEFFDFSTPEDAFWVAMVMALFPLMWTYSGWQDVTFVAGEVRNPEKMMPRILIVSVAAVVAIYLATNLVYMYTLGVDGLGASKNAAGEAAAIHIGPAFAGIITVCIMVSVFGSANGGMLVGSRLAYAMAQQGLTFRSLGIASERFGTPVVALLFIGGISTAYVVLIPDFIALVKQAAFAEILFGALGAGAVFVFRRRGVQTPFRTPLHPLFPIFFIVVAIWMLTTSVIVKWPNSLVVLGILVAAFPAYWIWRWLFPARVE